MRFSSAQRLGVTGRWVLVAATIGLLAVPGEAVDLSGSSGKYRLNIDTTLSWGGTYRVQDRDPSIISPFEGGTAWSVNGDDGNLNFDTGLVSNTIKATVDFDFGLNLSDRHSIGMFARGSAFYDFELMGDCCARTELTDEALDWAGNRAEFLDAYLWWQFGVGEFRVGRQVLNWGESTFIQGGLSGINSVDVSALRVPGAELREAFRPQGMAWASFALGQNLSVEGFYQFEWENTVVDPPGTYFSTNDFVGLGGETVFLAFASFPDTGESPFFIQPPKDYPFIGVPRGTDIEPEDGGQYGLALRWFIPSWGGTEFGFYYMNIHSRLPTINGVSGTLAGAQQASIDGRNAALAVYAYFGVPPGVSPEVDAAARGASQAAGVSAFAHTATWYTEYTEDISMYGLSWNSQLGTSGVAFQGEVSYRQDAPLQVDDVELLFAALSPINPVFAAQNQVVPGGVTFESDIKGYRLLDTSQLQFTMTKVFANKLGADQWVLLLEPGFNWVFDMPSKDELRFEGPGTYTSGNPYMSTTNPGAAHAGKDYEEAEHFADDFSWGYRFVTRLDYYNAIGAWQLSPRLAWQQDVDGVSPGPGGAFLEGFTALTVGLAASYQNRWEVDLSYTRYDGADRWNLINDRDFVGGFVKFSF
jgi:hypothetical protein